MYVKRSKALGRFPADSGMVSSLLHILVVTPVIFAMLRERELRKVSIETGQSV
jgi:hypothetical protein